MIERILLRMLLLAAFAACGSSSSPSNPDAAADGGRPLDASNPVYNSIPFSSGSDAPVLASLEYRCDPGPVPGYGYIEAQVVTTDPQGPQDLTNFTDDHLGMFPSDPPSGTERVLEFRLAIGGVQWAQTPAGWGRFYRQSDDSFVYKAMCAATTWPMDILVEDNTGHVTSGLVRGKHVDCC